MTIPTEKSDTEAFTPPSLANLPSPPVFLLRPATGREMRTYRRVMQVEGLVYHRPEDLRAEALRGLKALWSPEAYEEQSTRLQSFWAMADQDIEPEESEAKAVGELMERLTRAWRPLRVMAVDLAEFGERSFDITISIFLAGWKNFDCAYRMEDGRVPLDVIDNAKAKLLEIEQEAIDGKVEGVFEGHAFLQLGTAAARHLGLTGQEEKNSESPPSTPLAPSGSTTTQSEATEGVSSKASANSGSTKKGRSAGSRKRVARNA